MIRRCVNSKAKFESIRAKKSVEEQDAAVQKDEEELVTFGKTNWNDDEM